MTGHRVPLLVVACTAVLAAAGLGAAAGPAAASDTSATHAYIVADLQVVQFGAARIPHGEATLTKLVARVRRECPGAARNSPQNPESTMLSNEVIGLMVTSVVDTDLPSIRTYVRTASGLRWSRASINRSIQGYVGNVRTLTELHPPDICADLHSWAATGFTKLPATTLAFDARFVPAWVALGEIPNALQPFESASDRALVRTANRRELDLSEFEAREVYNWGHIMEALELNP
jgi:hypothetical protein